MSPDRGVSHLGRINDRHNSQYVIYAKCEHDYSVYQTQTLRVNSTVFANEREWALVDRIEERTENYRW